MVEQGNKVLDECFISNVAVKRNKTALWFPLLINYYEHNQILPYIRNKLNSYMIQTLKAYHVT